MTINEIQDEIIEEFSLLDDWMDRYQLLIDMGEGEEALPAADKTESNLIDGCQSRRPYTRRNTRRRTLFYRPYRFARASLPDALQWALGYGQTNANVRFSI